jgi:hypothetical protein
MRRSCRLAALWAFTAGCTGTPAPPSAPAQYLFAWAYDLDERAGDSNFVAVIAVDPASPDYGRVVATATTGAAGGMPHHTEQLMPAGGLPLVANAYHADRSVLLDLRDPLHPRIVGALAAVPGYHMPHSFFRLPDGNVVATLQFGDGATPGDPGGLALFTPDGRLLRSASSRDSTFPGAAIRTYSLDVSPATDRVLTTSSPMENVRVADVIQVWRLSDLTLLRTIAIPAVTTDSAWRYPFEVRFLPGGRAAFLNTYYCGFYLVTGLDGDAPQVERVVALEHPRYLECGVPTMIGRFWIMPVSAAREVLVFDLTDPRHPRRVGTLATDSSFVPHWSAPDPGSDRIVVQSESPADPRVLIARFDSATGALAWDETFRDPETGRLGVSFDRPSWPHGASGPAAPHGVVFSRSQRD